MSEGRDGEITVGIMCCLSLVRYTNHERSKKHRDNVALLKEMMEEEERESISPSADDVMAQGEVADEEQSLSDPEAEQQPSSRVERGDGGEQAGGRDGGEETERRKEREEDVGVSMAGLRVDEDNDEDLALSSLVR